MKFSLRRVLSVAALVLALASCGTQHNAPKDTTVPTAAPSAKPAPRAPIVNVVTFATKAGTYEVSVDNKARVVMLDIHSVNERPGQPKTVTTPDTRAVVFSEPADRALSASIVSYGQQAVVCTYAHSPCIYKEPLVWDKLIPQDFTAYTNDTLSYEREAFYNPYVRPAPVSTLGEYHEYKSFVFLGEASSYAVKLDQDWKVVDILTLTSDKNTRLNIVDAHGNNTECFAGETCTYLKDPKPFAKLVETDAGGIGRTITLTEIKHLPRY